MMNILKATGKWGGILALIALALVLVKQLIALVGVISFAIKALIVLAFVAVFLIVGYMIFKSWSDRKKEEQSL